MPGTLMGASGEKTDKNDLKSELKRQSVSAPHGAMIL